jgi:hypothetical protein
VHYHFVILGATPTIPKAEFKDKLSMLTGIGVKVEKDSKGIETLVAMDHFPTLIVHKNTIHCPPDPNDAVPNSFHIPHESGSVTQKSFEEYLINIMLPWLKEQFPELANRSDADLPKITLGAEHILPLIKGAFLAITGKRIIAAYKACGLAPGQSKIHTQARRESQQQVIAAAPEVSCTTKSKKFQKLEEEEKKSFGINMFVTTRSLLSLLCLREDGKSCEADTYDRKKDGLKQSEPTIISSLQYYQQTKQKRLETEEKSKKKEEKKETTITKRVQTWVGYLDDLEEQFQCVLRNVTATEEQRQLLKAIGAQITQAIEEERVIILVVYVV